MVARNLEGCRFGRLTVAASLPSKYKKTRWLCVCDCGGRAEVSTTHLVSGHTQSCGCLQRQRTGESAKTHGSRHSRLYNSWEHMKQRCNNPRNKDYKYYGGRGIKVTPEWSDFTCFQAWATAHGYEENLTIDRIDVNGDYCPENCRWSTQAEQNRNKRPRKKGVML